MTISSSTTPLLPGPSLSSITNSTSLSSSAVAGLIIGVLALLLIVSGAWFIYRRKKPSTSPNLPLPTPYYHPPGYQSKELPALIFSSELASGLYCFVFGVGFCVVLLVC